MPATHDWNRRELIWPVALACVAAVAYALLGADRQAPTIYPDEAYYGELARSLGDHLSYSWRGAGIGVRSLYPFAIAPAWALADGVGAYNLAKLIGAALTASTVIPAYLIVRSVGSRAAARVVTVLLAAAAWTVMTTQLMSENLAWPLVTWSLAALLLALQDRSKAWLVYVSLGFSVAAAATRLQLAAVALAIPLALGLEWLRRSSAERPEWLGAYGRPLAVCGGLGALAGIAVLVTSGGVLGSYDVVWNAGPALSHVLWWSGNNVFEAALMVGVVPVVLMLAMAMTRANWRDPRVAPLLSVSLPVFMLVCATTGWFLAGETPRLIDRYLIYLAPLTLAAVVVAPGRVRPIFAIAWALALALPIVGYPLPPLPLGEADALFNAIDRVGGWPAPGESEVRALVPVAVLVAGAGAAAGLIAAKDTPVARWTLIALVGGWMLLASAGNWDRARTAGLASRSLLPPERQWIDNRSAGTTAILYTAPNPGTIVLANELFNESVTRAYALPPYDAGDVAIYGSVCDDVKIDPRTGAIGEPPHSGSFLSTCPRTLPPNLLVVGSDTQVTFRNGRVVADYPELPLQLVQIRNGPPRLISRVRSTCVQQQVCATLGTIEVWPRARAVLTVKLSAAPAPAVLQIGKRRVRLGAGAGGLVEVPVAAGRNNLRVVVRGKPSAAATRQIERVWLTEPGAQPSPIYRAAPSRQRAGIE